MKTTLSSKGQVVLPAAVRRRLGLLPGAEMRVNIEANRVILEPLGRTAPKIRQTTSPISGLPVIEITDVHPPLTSEQVNELLTDCP